MLGANNPFYLCRQTEKQAARPPYFRARNDLTLGRNGKIILSSHPKKRLVNAATAAEGKEEEAKYGGSRSDARDAQWPRAACRSLCRRSRRRVGSTLAHEKRGKRASLLTLGSGRRNSDEMAWVKLRTHPT